jgi:DNA-binding response OmpR family regulator
MQGRPSKHVQTSFLERQELSAPATTIQVLWLQLSDEEGGVPPSLREGLAAHSWLLYCMTLEGKPGEAFRNFDLILLRVTDQTYGRVREVIHQVRAYNRAPILLLTDQHLYEWSLVALPAGADAVVLVDAPPEITVARCRALLRRWLASG